MSLSVLNLRILVVDENGDGEYQLSGHPNLLLANRLEDGAIWLRTTQFDIHDRHIEPCHYRLFSSNRGLLQRYIRSLKTFSQRWCMFFCTVPRLGRINVFMPIIHVRYCVITTATIYVYHTCCQRQYIVSFLLLDTQIRTGYVCLGGVRSNLRAIVGHRITWTLIYIGLDRLNSIYISNLNAFARDCRNLSWFTWRLKWHKVFIALVHTSRKQYCQ